MEIQKAYTYGVNLSKAEYLQTSVYLYLYNKKTNSSSASSWPSLIRCIHSPANKCILCIFNTVIIHSLSYYCIIITSFYQREIPLTCTFMVYYYYHYYYGLRLNTVSEGSLPEAGGLQYM